MALARARYSSTSGFYDSQRDLKIHAQLHLAFQHKDERLFKGPLGLFVTFYMPIPKTWSQKRRLAIVGHYHSKRCDLDNQIKYLLDTCNKCVFSDDAQVAEISARKIYGMAPSTVFTLVELGEKEHVTTEAKESTEANKEGNIEI